MPNGKSRYEDEHFLPVFNQVDGRQNKDDKQMVQRIQTNDMFAYSKIKVKLSISSQPGLICRNFTPNVRKKLFRYKYRPNGISIFKWLVPFLLFHRFLAGIPFLFSRN